MDEEADIYEAEILNTNFYIHKLIINIIDSLKQDPRLLPVYVDLLERTLAAKGLLGEDYDEAVKQILEDTKEDNRELRLMKIASRKYELLLRKILEGRTRYEPVEL